MLVLSRKRDQSIMIGDNIRIVIVDIRGDKVRVGVQADKEVPIWRQEVYEAIQRHSLLDNTVHAAVVSAKSVGVN